MPECFRCPHPGTRACTDYSFVEGTDTDLKLHVEHLLIPIHGFIAVVTSVRHMMNLLDFHCMVAPEMLKTLLYSCSKTYKSANAESSLPVCAIFMPRANIMVVIKPIPTFPTIFAVRFPLNNVL